MYLFFLLWYSFNIEVNQNNVLTIRCKGVYNVYYFLTIGT